MDLDGIRNARREGTLVTFLDKFNAANSTVMDFANVDFFCRKEIVSIVEDEFSLPQWDKQKARALLNSLRLLARDDKNVDVIFGAEQVQKYVTSLAALPLDPKHPVDLEVKTDATKCLVNALFKSAAMQLSFGRSSHFALRESLQNFADSSSLSDGEKFVYNLSLRVLFITTAVQPSIRTIWREEEYFNTLLKIFDQALNATQLRISDRISTVNEVLKTLFSLFCKKLPNENVNQATEVLTRAKALLSSHFVDDNDCCQNSMNLISTLPEMSDILCPSVSPENKSIVQFDGRDMTIIQLMLEKMEQRIDEDDLSLVAIYLTAILEYSAANAQVRRYVRLMILPPLKDADVKRHPDEGETLRNKLIRIMKGLGNAAEIASQLMFVLCKQSVGRMIKYTGFGHAAGLLANKQLLGHINIPKNEDNSEDSETEEYAAVEDQVNPVTGCIRPQQQKSPFEGMSEEQKEFEAVKLMNAMNQMLEAGVIKPGTVGDDGNVRPLSHILEMTKNVKLENDPASDSD